MQQFTKKEIKSSMLRLLQSKSLDSIKVKDLIDDIGISRNTFYYHYHDIYDVLKDIFDDTLTEFNKPSTERFEWEKAFQKMSEDSLIKKNIIKNIFKSRYSDEIKSYVTNIVGDVVYGRIKAEFVSENKQVDEYDLKIITTFYKHAVTGTFFEWVYNGMDLPPKEFMEKLGKISAKYNL